MAHSIWRRLTPCLVLLCGASAVHAWGLPQQHLYPVGGGYEQALKGFSLDVMRHAHGSAVRIVMVPAAFADDPVLPEDPGILADDVAALQTACDAVVNKAVFPAGCIVSSVPLYVAADAEDPRIVAALANPSLDGVFFNGGDQGYAMKILARSSAEAAMAEAAERGVVFGGTSAGAAIESRGMNAGYTDAGDSTTALQKASIDLWLGRPAQHRGLSFGSRQVLIDEHVYSRGRLGRMLNAGAQSADALGNGGLLGLGFDYDTGAAIDQDRWLTGVSGVSSAVAVDFQTAGARYQWVGPQEALSARRVLVHLLPPSSRLAFDLAHRVPVLAGRPVLWDGDLREERPLLMSEHRATVILSGDVSQDLTGPVTQAFVRQAGGRRSAPLLVLAAGYANRDDAEADARAYAGAAIQAGWQGGAITSVIGTDCPDVQQLKYTGGLIWLGADQSLLTDVVASPSCQAFARQALRDVPVVMFERGMAAAAGEQFDAVPEGDSADDAIAAFTAHQAQLRPGLGVVRGVFEPRLQIDMRWGRLFGAGAALSRGRPPLGSLGVYGISESSAIMLKGYRANVLGLNPVVTLDVRHALFFDGDNGALGALNVLLDVHEPGEMLGR